MPRKHAQSELERDRDRDARDRQDADEHDVGREVLRRGLHHEAETVRRGDELGRHERRPAHAEADPYPGQDVGQRVG